jgi:hypothetical protein
VRIGLVASALVACAILGAVLAGKVGPSGAERRPATAREADSVRFVGKGPETGSDFDVADWEDPCKTRKLTDGKVPDMEYTAEKLQALMGSSDYDPCKVSKEAAIKAEMMMRESLKADKEHKNLRSSKDANSTAGNLTANQSSFAKNKTKEMNEMQRKQHNRTKSDKKGHKKGPTCSGQGEDCSKSQCCSTPGMQCYMKNSDFSMCRESCTPGRDPLDVNSDAWNCTEIGKRSKGSPPTCSQAGENCIDSQCCYEPGAQCFKKNDEFAMCRQYCTPGPDYTDSDWHYWSCEALGMPAPSKGEWVEEECSGDEDDCRSNTCCKSSGHTCFEKGEGWAQCKADCNPEQNPDEPWEDPWSCKKLGPTTPWGKPGWNPSPDGGKVSSWVKDHCAATGTEDCSKSQCCRGVGMQCYKKTEGWAVCKESCTPGRDPADNNETWSCDTLGARSYGLALKGYPSLFCFAVLRVNGYELPLVQAQWEARSGIFNCDGYVTFSDEVIEIAEQTSLQTPNIPVGISKDGTAGNTELFMGIWDMLFDDGRLWNYDWTIKADPDAVLLPDRLRNHLAPHTGWGEHDGKLFVVNCNAWPSSPSFPMLYGAVEVFSNKAMKAYETLVWKCKRDLQYGDWGEDLFLTRCFDQIDVGRILDFTLVGDDLCVGPGQGGAENCNSPDRAGFHPFKNFDDWMNCFNTAIGRI